MAWFVGMVRWGRGGRRVGAALRLSAALLCGACALAPAAREETPERPFVRAWPVMGTVLRVTVWASDPAEAEELLGEARRVVFRVDTLMSVYKPESEVSVVNRRAGTDSVTVVSPETAEVLGAALDYGALTGGALDVTVGPLVDLWGFYRHAGRLPAPEALDSVRGLVGYRRVELDRAARAVRLPRRGMRLDFGAIAKGYAVDLAVAALRRGGAVRALVDLGGNLGFLGQAPGGGAWEVGLRDPRDPEGIFGTVSLDSGAVATSGDSEQFFVHEGVRYSHIFDPRTGWPARGVASVSVVAPTGQAADALSTALFVLGPEEGCAVAARFPGVEAVWVLDRGEVPATGGPGETIGEIVITPGLEGRFELHDSASRGRSGGVSVRSCRPRQGTTR